MDSPAFVSYVHDDAELVARLCSDLQNVGVKLWLDRENLLPGVRWQDAIKSAIESGSYFIACFSANSTKRTKTYMNEELLIAVDELRMRSRDRTWFLPVMLSSCEVPATPIGAAETLRSIQHVDLSAAWADGIQKLLKVLKPAGTSNEEQLLAAANARIAGYIENLASAEAETRSIAEQDLLAYGSAAVPSLVRALEHTNGRINGHVLTLLGRLGHTGTNAVPALLTRLERELGGPGGNAGIASNLIRTLGLIGDAHAVPVLTRVFATDSTSMREAAETALLRIGECGIEALTKLFHSGADELRVRAAQALLFPVAFGRYHDLEKQTENVRSHWPDLTVLFDAIKTLATSTDPATAKAATRALHTLHVIDPEVARPTLLAALRRTEPAIRAMAIWVLRGLKVKDPDVIQALRSLKSDSDAQVQEAARLALRELLGTWRAGPYGGLTYKGSSPYRVGENEGKTS